MSPGTPHDLPMGHLPVMEAFHTIQGEGFHTGKAAYFIRLAGCDVGCVWCDIKESWPVNAGNVLSIDEIVCNARTAKSVLVVVTGGEPLMYDLSGLTSALKKAGMQCNVETSGTYALSGDWDWVCFSPKKFKEPKPEYYRVAGELKIIVFNPSDFQWAEEHAGKCGPETKFFLQPEWSKRDEMMPLISDYVMNNPKWRVSLQTHKYMGIP